MATAAHTAPQLEADDSIEEVQDATRLRFLLMRLREERAWLNVTLRGSATHFRSLIIDLDLKHGRLVLDELMPREVPAGLPRGHPMRVSAELDGGRIMFDTTFDEVMRVADAPAVFCHIPASLSHWQRRREHRSVVGYGATIPVELTGEDHAGLRGRLFDISSSGLSVTLAQDANPQIALDAGQANALIELSGGEYIEAPVDLLYVQSDGTEAPARIGGRFRSMTPAQQRKIVRFVMECEREAARRRTAISQR